MNPEGSKIRSRGSNPLQAGDTPGTGSMERRTPAGVQERYKCVNPSAVIAKPKARGLFVERAAPNEAELFEVWQRGGSRSNFDGDRGSEMNEMQSVLSVTVKSGFVLEITFEDGKAFVLDFKPWTESETGWLFDPLKDPEFFARVFVHGGALEWPNGLDICSDGLRAWCEQGSVPLPQHH